MKSDLKVIESNEFFKPVTIIQKVVEMEGSLGRRRSIIKVNVNCLMLNLYKFMYCSYIFFLILNQSIRLENELVSYIF